MRDLSRQTILMVFLLQGMLSACQAAPAATAIQVVTPTEINCNSGYDPTMGGKVHLTGNVIDGSVFAGPIVNATIRFYTLEYGGKLLPVALARRVCTVGDGSYETTRLPNEVDGKTLVIEASGGSFVDEASGQTFSFEGHSLYSVIPVIEFGRPLGGVVTPLTDMAFRQTRYALSADPGLSPSEQASYNNFWVGKAFGLETNDSQPNQVETVKPTNLFDSQPHIYVDMYALILAGLSQQAADAGISPVDWIAQLSADADDGNLDGAARSSAIPLPAAMDKFLAGPRNPLPFKSITTPTPAPK
jgi:hypothetical protein